MTKTLLKLLVIRKTFKKRKIKIASRPHVNHQKLRNSHRDGKGKAYIYYIIVYKIYLSFYHFIFKYKQFINKLLNSKYYYSEQRRDELLEKLKIPTQREKNLFIFYHLLALTRMIIKLFIKDFAQTYIQSFKNANFTLVLLNCYLNFLN